MQAGQTVVDRYSRSGYLLQRAQKCFRLLLLSQTLYPLPNVLAKMDLNMDLHPPLRQGFENMQRIIERICNHPLEILKLIDAEDQAVVPAKQVKL